MVNLKLPFSFISLTLLFTSKSFGFSYGSKVYFILYSDDIKMDQLIQETDRNREMINQIAHRTFTTNAPDQGMLPTGQGVSRKHIFTPIKILYLYYFWLFLSLLRGLIPIAPFRMAKLLRQRHKTLRLCITDIKENVRGSVLKVSIAPREPNKTFHR